MQPVRRGVGHWPGWVKGVLVGCCLPWVVAGCGQPATGAGTGVPGNGSAATGASSGAAAGNQVGGGGVATTTFVTAFTPQQVVFVNSQTGYVAGLVGKGDATQAVLYGTVDGGRTWHRLFASSASASIQTVAMAVHGPYVWLATGNEDPSAQGMLFASADGGRSFRVVSRVPLTDVDFTSTLEGWAVRGGGDPVHAQLVYTGDGGASWTVVSLPPTLTHGWAPRWVSFGDATHGLLLVTGVPGAGQQMKEVLRTDNGGRTWTVMTTTEGATASSAFGGGGYGEGIGTVPGIPEDVYLWESRGSLLQSTDGGRDWRALPLGQPEVREVQSMAMLNSQEGFALVHDMASGLDRLVHTQDGWRTWSTLFTWPRSVA